MIDIILPVYEESDNIKPLLENIKKNIKTSHNLYFIYDKKSDPTLRVLKKYKKSNIYIIQNKYKKGFMNAIKTGIKASKASVICIMMADLSDDTKDVDRMHKLIQGGSDIVCASRYTEKGKRIGGPKVKAFMSNFACISLKIITGIPTNDSTNAFKMFRREIIDQIKIESEMGFEFPLELTVKSYLLNKKISEVSTKWEERDRGESKFNFIKLAPYYLRWYFYLIKNTYKNKFRIS